MAVARRSEHLQQNPASCMNPCIETFLFSAHAGCNLAIQFVPHPQPSPSHQLTSVHYTSVHSASVHFTSIHFISFHIISLWLPGCFLLGRQCDLSTSTRLQRTGALWFLGWVLLGRQCDLSTRKELKWGLGVFCSAGNMI